MSQNVLNDITKTGIKLILEEPFYGHLFSSLLKETNVNTETISLSVLAHQIGLKVNPTFWEELISSNEKYGYIKHQLLHLALKHPFQKESFQYKHIFDIASDLVVNQYIHPMHLPLDAITLDKYPQLKNIELGKDVGYYYRKILELNQQKEQKDPSLPDENHPQLKQHQDWNSLNQSPRMEQRMIEEALKDNLIRAAERTDEKNWGKLPSSLYRLIQEHLQKKAKEIDWRRVLRLFLGTGRKSYIKNTIRRPSKRYGTTPGIQVKNKQKILVAIDTSGSISIEEIAIFFTEINHIHQQGTEIMIVECDAEIKNIYPFNNIVPKEIKGGGGTLFDPVLEYSNQKYKPDLIVYFTDGFAPIPQVKSRFPILWLISSDGIEKEKSDMLQGRKVKMNKV